MVGSIVAMRSIFVCLLFAIASTKSSRILVSQPYGTKSHQGVFVPLINALSERGHDVLYITNQISPKLSRLPNVRQLVLEKAFFHAGLATNPFQQVLKKDPASWTSQIFSTLGYTSLVEGVARSILDDPRVRALLTDEQFDLVLVSQAYDASGYAMAWHFQVPFILVSPSRLFPFIASTLGDSYHSEYVPSVLGSSTDGMIFMERLENTLMNSLVVSLFDTWPQSRLQREIERVFPNIPSFVEIRKNVSLVFTNTHPVFNYPRTLPPQVIEIGAIHCRPARALPTVHRFEFFGLVEKF